MSPRLSLPALESKLVSQFCEDENGALIYNRVTNGYNGNNGNYAVGGYGYRPVTEKHVLSGGGQGDRSRVETQGSSSTHV